MNNDQTLYVNNQSFGNQQVVGTREQFRTAFADMWAEWHRDADTDMSLEEFIQDSLDRALDEATAEEVEELTASGMSLSDPS